MFDSVAFFFPLTSLWMMSNGEEFVETRMKFRFLVIEFERFSKCHQGAFFSVFFCLSIAPISSKFKLKFQSFFFTQKRSAFSSPCICSSFFFLSTVMRDLLSRDIKAFWFAFLRFIPCMAHTSLQCQSGGWANDATCMILYNFAKWHNITFFCMTLHNIPWFCIVFIFARSF